MTKFFCSLMAILVLSACGSNSPNQGQKPSGSDDPAPETAEALLCSVAQLDHTLLKCGSQVESRALPRLKKTILAWADEKGEFSDVYLKRTSFQKRYSLSLPQTQCLQEQLCKEVIP